MGRPGHPYLRRRDELPAKGARRGVTYLERQGRRTTALVHDPAVLKDPDLASTVLEAVRFVVEQDRLRGRIEATATLAAALPTGFVTFLMSDIEDSTVLLRKLGDRYGALLNDVRGILRTAVARAGGREIDARADELNEPSPASRSRRFNPDGASLQPWPSRLED